MSDIALDGYTIFSMHLGGAIEDWDAKVACVTGGGRPNCPGDEWTDVWIELPWSPWHYQYGIAACLYSPVMMLGVKWGKYVLCVQAP